MRVKVTPRDGAGNPIPGAGSFEVEADRCQGRFYLPETDTLLPASWCEPIPEITPEPGDIVEGDGGVPFYYHPEKTHTIVKKIVARKPKGGIDAHDAIHEFFRDLSDAETASADVAAYNKFLSAILGGAEYGRVEG